MSWFYPHGMFFPFSFRRGLPVHMFYAIFPSFLLLLQEVELLQTFSKLIEDDRRIILSRNNLIELHKVWWSYIIVSVMLLHRILLFGVVINISSFKSLFLVPFVFPYPIVTLDYAFSVGAWRAWAVMRRPFAFKDWWCDFDCRK